MSFRIAPALPLEEEIRRLVTEEAGAAITILKGTAKGRHVELHGARKRLKKLRGVLRIVRPGNKAFCTRENARYRDIAFSLSAARDAGALVETVDRFIGEFTGEETARQLAAVRGALTRRRDRIVRAHADEGDAVSAAVAGLHEGIEALSDLDLPHDREAAAQVLARGVHKVLSGAADSLKHARGRGHPEDFHELRKAVKYHWMHLGLLRDVWPGDVASRRKGMNALGELLGELNDIDVMRALLAAEGDEIAAPDALAVFGRLMKRKEKSLRAECIVQASHLFDLRPKKTGDGVARRYLKASGRGDRKGARDRAVEAEPIEV